MKNEVRTFLLRLSIELMRKCIYGARLGKLGVDAVQVLRRLNQEVEAMKSFQEHPQNLAVVTSVRNTITTLAEKLADGDWQHLETVVNLLEELTQGNVLQVEPEDFQQLAAQLPTKPQPETETFTNTPQL